MSADDAQTTRTSPGRIRVAGGQHATPQGSWTRSNGTVRSGAVRRAKALVAQPDWRRPRPNSTCRRRRHDDGGRDSRRAFGHAAPFDPLDFSRWRLSEGLKRHIASTSSPGAGTFAAANGRGNSSGSHGRACAATSTVHAEFIRRGIYGSGIRSTGTRGVARHGNGRIRSTEERLALTGTLSALLTSVQVRCSGDEVPVINNECKHVVPSALQHGLHRPCT